MDYNRNLKLIVLFILSYILLYFLPTITSAMNFFPMHPWGDPFNFAMMDYMFFLIPIPGFFFTYLLIDWVDEYFNTTFGHSLWFPIIFLLIAILAFYVVVFWQNCNLLTLSPNIGGEAIPFTGCSSEAAGTLMAAMPERFPEYLKESAYIVFVLAGMLGWASKLILERIEEEE